MPRRTAADHQDLLLRGERGHVVALGAEAGIDAAVPGFVVGAAAVTALGAGLDFELPARADLLGIIVVGEDAAVEADKIGLALAQHLLGRVAVETGHRHHGDLDHFLDPDRQGNVAQRSVVRPVHLLGELAQGDVWLGIEQVIRQIRALVHARPVVADVEGIDPGRLVDAGDLLAFRDGQPLVAGADLEGVHEYLHREVLAAALLDLVDDGHDETGAVLHALRTVHVVTLVPEARQEAVEEVVGGGVDLDAVPTGLLQTVRTCGEAVHQLLDLLDGQSVRRLLIVHIERGVHGHRRGGHSLGDEGVDAAPGSPMVELGVDGDAVLVYFVRQFGEVLDVFVVVYAEAPVAHFQQGPLHSGRLGDDHARRRLAPPLRRRPWPGCRPGSLRPRRGRSAPRS